MLKYFRNIRQKLIERENLKKYVIYAIGEILLVMFGILLALQVGNLNEMRKNKSIALDYLKEINSEFRKNKEQLNLLLEMHKSACDACDKIANLAPFMENNWDSIYYYYRQDIFLAPRFNPSANSIESLISSASLNIIKNSLLRELLLDWNNNLDDWKEEETEATNSVLDIRKWIYENVNMNIVWSENSFGSTTLINSEKLWVFQNLIRRRCLYANFMFYGDPFSYRNETLRLMETIDRIISLSQS